MFVINTVVLMADLYIIRFNSSKKTKTKNKKKQANKQTNKQWRLHLYNEKQKITLWRNSSKKIQ